MRQDVWKIARIVGIVSPTTVEVQYSIRNQKGETVVKTLKRCPRQLCLILSEDEYGINTHEYLEKLRDNCECVGF